MPLTLRQDSETGAILLQGSEHKGTINKGSDGLWRTSYVATGEERPLSDRRAYETLDMAFAAIQQAVNRPRDF